MTQTKKGSFVEAWVNVVVGIGIGYLTNIYVLPWFGLMVTKQDALFIGLIFTAISLVRSYCLRRFFNWIKFGNEPTVQNLNTGSEWTAYDAYGIVKSMSEQGLDHLKSKENPDA